MTWTTLGDDYFDRPALMAVSRSARLLDVEGKVWCNRILSDGAIVTAALRRLSDSDQLDADVAELVAAGLWAATEDGYLILNWTEDQEPAEKVRARRDAGKERQARYRDRQERHGRGDHTACDPRYCRDASRAASQDESATASVTAPLSHPSPPRPSPTPREGKEQGRSADASGSLGVAVRRTSRKKAPPQGFIVVMPGIEGRSA